jgi:tRNA uridine 5-carboxymethylaminomethyl modification enzyme
MVYHPKKYDIIVVGAGHAGCEAALAAARMGCSVLLMAIDLDKLAAMPCSPSIGGMAKGQLVKELDALGGEMAKITDKTAISFRTLNTKKGPAVHSSRTQNDKIRYHTAMKAVIETQPNLDLKQTLAERLVVEGKRVAGVEDHIGFGYQAQAVVLATGTFLSGLLHIGFNSFRAGRAGEFASYGLATDLKKLGFDLGRMKTGTPPRLKKASIDFSKFKVQESDANPVPFSYFSDALRLPQLPSHIGYTNSRSHKIVRKNLERSALYGGIIQGISARYCPSFEDKIVKFPDKDRHQVILEPEGIDTQEIYTSGLGNSLPLEIQIGTSGYEEAAAQGLWAGINAACQIQKREPFVLDRSQAYMGVMVDDLVTRGTREPYRMFTSRAEYRLMLREDNASLRLMETGHELGLIGDDTLKEIKSCKTRIDHEIQRIKQTIIKPDDRANQYLQSSGTQPIQSGTFLDQLLKRAELGYEVVEALAKAPQPPGHKVAQQVEIEIKYEGYIQKQLNEIKKFKNLESIKLPEDLDFFCIHGLSNELKEKLSHTRPTSLGQASRIDGMTPAAISVLMIALKAATKSSST